MKNRLPLLLLLFCFISSTFAQDCAEDEVFVQIEMQADAWGYETSWVLSSSNGDVYLSVNEGDYASNQVYQHEVCIPQSACATLAISDSYGDGGPTYSVVLDGAIVTEKRMEGSFESFEFNCMPGTGCGSPLAIAEGDHIAPVANTWYAFTPDSIGTYLISTCAHNDCNTKIWLYESCPQTITSDNKGTIYYNDDFCNNQASIENAILNVGNTYIIRIGDSNLDCGDSNIPFTIAYNGAVSGCTDPDACNYNPLATVDDGSCLPDNHPDCPQQGPDLAIDQDDLVNSIYLTTLDNNDGCAIAEGCIQGYGLRDILRFTTTIHNLGDADYFIGEPTANPDQFTYDNCHNHSHYDGYAEYVLYSEDGTEIPIGFKNGFCVLDLLCSTGNYQYGCNYMGISAGCSDIYDAYLDCQWIDVTDVDDGTYTFVARVNWDNAPDALGQVEKDSINNWGQVCITLDRSSGVLAMNVENDCAPYTDCAGEIYGSAQPDCTGECGGTVLMGDLNNSGAQEMLDAVSYTDGVIEGIAATPCNDLNADGLISIYDAALLSNCMLYGQSHTHEETGPHNHCNFPDGNVNPNHAVEFSIIDVDFDAQYVDVGIHSENADIVAYQFQMSGLMIQSVENLVDESTYPISPRASTQQSMITGISYEDNTITRSLETQALVRVFYSALTADSICISQTIEAVNHNYEQTSLSVVGGCVFAEPNAVTNIDLDLDVNFSPNPFSSQTTLTINSNKSEAFDLDIYSSTGALIDTYKDVSSSFILKKETLSAGIYLYKLKGKDGFSTGKLVKL